ncbi:MAG: hypothetical protein CM15mP103_11240 [Gammaproteobacteria bacterium]|nr:MAG: hypothetical protein CM15mP103_11240 [Gammaproteobacteria bacterium]
MTARQLKHGVFLGFFKAPSNPFGELLLQAMPCQWRGYNFTRGAEKGESSMRDCATWVLWNESAGNESGPGALR